MHTRGPAPADTGPAGGCGEPDEHVSAVNKAPDMLRGELGRFRHSVLIAASSGPAPARARCASASPGPIAPTYPGIAGPVGCAPPGRASVSQRSGGAAGSMAPPPPLPPAINRPPPLPHPSAARRPPRSTDGSLRLQGRNPVLEGPRSLPGRARRAEAERCPCSQASSAGLCGSPRAAGLRVGQRTGLRQQGAARAVSARSPPLPRIRASGARSLVSLTSLRLSLSHLSPHFSLPLMQAPRCLSTF